MKKDFLLSQQPYTAPVTSLGAEVLDNFYLENAGSTTAKARYYQVGRQGLRLLFQNSGAGVCRCIFTASNNRTFGVWGSGFYEVLTGGSSKQKLGTLATSSGIVTWAENGYDVIVVDGQYGYTLKMSGNVWNQITDEYFPGQGSDTDTSYGPSHVACVDTYFLVNSLKTNKYFWSAPYYQPYAFDATNKSILNLWWGEQYGQKIGDTDAITGMIGMGSLLFVFGQNSMEAHQNTGNSYGQLFARVPGLSLGYGLLAPYSLTKYGGAAYWLGRDRSGTVGIFRMGADYTPQMISPRGVQTRIQSYSKISDCYAFTYYMDGHAFAVFNFPSGTSTDGGDENGATWVFDITTGAWYRYTRWNAADGSAYRWRASFATYNWSQLIMGDATSDALYDLDNAYFQDDSPEGATEYIERIVTSPITYDNNKRLFIQSAQLNLQQGMGTRQGQGADPVAWMAVSWDGGFTFANERARPMGSAGKYTTRTRWMKCGSGRNCVRKYRITEPIKIVILGETLEFGEMSS